MRALDAFIAIFTDALSLLQYQRHAQKQNSWDRGIVEVNRAENGSNRLGFLNFFLCYFFTRLKILHNFSLSRFLKLVEN